MWFFKHARKNILRFKTDWEKLMRTRIYHIANHYMIIPKNFMMNNLILQNNEIKIWKYELNIQPSL